MNSTIYLLIAAPVITLVMMAVVVSSERRIKKMLNNTNDEEQKTILKYRMSIERHYIMIAFSVMLYLVIIAISCIRITELLLIK